MDKGHEMLYIQKFWYLVWICYVLFVNFEEKSFQGSTASYYSAVFFNRNSYNGDLQSSWRICVRFSSNSFSHSFCLLFLSPQRSSFSASLSLWPRTKSGSLSSQIPLFYVRNWVFWKGEFWQRERAETFIAAIYGAAQPEALFPVLKRNCKRGWHI